MKLTYWVAKCLDDSDRYSIRCKTRKEVVEILKGCDTTSFSPPFKTTIEYEDGFDLMSKCMTEDCGWWEYQDQPKERAA